MTRINEHKVIARWAKVGVLFNVKPAKASPDPERLLLDTARLCRTNARLFTLAVTWLATYGTYIARHRLKHLVIEELELEYRPVLGLIIDTAIAHGAYRELHITIEPCKPTGKAAPLFDVDRETPTYAALVKKTATPQSRKWRRWVQPFELQQDAIRPATWILKQDPRYRDRALRKGDLRCSIIEVLKRDTADGFVSSESELARLCSANRIAVRRAIDDLAIEGIDLRDTEPIDNRSTPLRLVTAA